MSLSGGSEHDSVPELSPSHGALHGHYTTAVSDDDLPEPGKPRRTRRGSSASHVPLDHFDPQGMHELQRTLTTRTARSRTTSHTAVTGDMPLDEKFDLESVLQGFMKKANEQNIKRRSLGIMFEDLRVVGTGASAAYQDTLGSTFNPAGILEGIKNIRHPPLRDIISGFEGVLTPGEMLLVLGRPGSGCSTLLKTLANHRGEYRAVDGDVHYDSFSPSDIAKHYRGDVIYCPEDDVHFPTLTVGETLSFAATTRAPQARIQETRSQYVNDLTELLMTVFGLRHARNTQVGDASIRGVSGGEKKRVSISEALAAKSLIGAWDNSTRGLDASTALEFVRALRIATDIAGLTTIVSIYQAGESLYELFDKVCVIAEGKMAYYGRADEARQYFIDMGFEPADRQTTADFLVAVTDPIGRIVRPGFESRVPRTSDELAAHFKRSSQGISNRQSIEEYRSEHVGQEHKVVQYKQSVKAERAKHTHETSSYTISIPMQVRAVMKRRVQILKGDLTAQIIQLASFIFQAIIMGTVFLKVPDSTSAYFSRGGVLFFALLFGALTAMAEIPALFSQRPIVNRHHKAAMYHPFAEALALTLVDIPVTLITQIFFSVILYFLVRLQQSAGQFFIFYLFVITATITMKAFFRVIASAFLRESSAQAVAGVAILPLVLYTGYTIPMPSMIGALKWITYINPLRYGFEALIANEFHTLNGTCASLIPQGPGYENISLANQVCTTVGSQPGQPNVDGNTFIALSYGYSYSHVWRNFGILVAFAGGFLALLLFFSEINTASVGDNAVIQFKRGSENETIAAAENEVAADEEKGTAPGSPGPDSSATSGSSASQTKEEQAIAEMDVPTTTDIFSWQGVHYVVPVGSGQTRQLLDDVSGYVAPGKLTALMGESGAGKTTLLNVLAQRTGTGVVTGGRFVNGQPLPLDFQAQTGYCQQTDTHLPEMTVREALLFSARLRQPPSVPMEEKEAYVEMCLKMCGLEQHADAIVGSLGVEHRKRTTIGVELAAKPKLLLFLDEPTSGLDSQSAWAIMAFLRSLADNGQAILCTIHQPSSELFQVFDRLLLLRKGGQTVYFGDLGRHSSTLIKYFERNGAQHCGPRTNPAEWMLDVIGAGATASSEKDWHSVWIKSHEATSLQSELESIHSEGRSRPPVVTTRKSEFSTSWGYQVYALTHRGFTSYWRNPTYLMAKLLLNVAGGLFIGFTFWKSKDTLQGTQNKLFAIFMGTILCVPLANQLQTIFIASRDIYEIRERPSRMYSWTALVTSQIIVEVPWNFLGSSIFFFCWYWTVGFASDRAGYTYLVYGIVFPAYYTTIGQAVAAMSPNSVIAALLFSVLFSFVITFNGVLQPFSQLGWWRWMYRVSPFTYLIEGLLGQAIGHSTVSCAPQEFAILEPPSGQTCSQYMQNFISAAGGYLENPDATTDCQFCSARTTDELLKDNFNIFYSHRWRNVGIILGVTVFNIAAIYFLTWWFRIRTTSVIGSIKNRIAAWKKKSEQ